MTSMKANGPWKPNDFPNHYLPCPEIGLLPPVFVLGVVLDYEQWLQFAEQKQLIKNDRQRSNSVDIMYSINLYLSEACGHSVRLYTCHPTDDGMFAFAFESNYTLTEDGPPLQEPLAKMRNIFADYGREPKWYLDFGTNAENFDREDWTIDIEIIVCSTFYVGSFES